MVRLRDNHTVEASLEEFGSELEVVDAGLENACREVCFTAAPNRARRAKNLDSIFVNVTEFKEIVQR